MKINQEKTKKLLAALAVIIFALLIGHLVSVISFNEKVYTVRGADDTQASYMAFADRADNTSSWVKRDYDLYGETVDLEAVTVDGTFYNHSSHPIVSWEMTLKIRKDCMINNAWCGTVEIHQFVGTDKEAVQTLDLRNYDIRKVKLEYLYDGDLLIPLQKGDYIIYYPSKKDDEVPIGPDSEMTIGTIFYYLSSLDLSDYEISYSYYRGFAEGWCFYGIMLLVLIWIIIFIMMWVARITYRQAANEMDIRMSGVSYMSELYDIIYIIDLETDRLDVITADEESEKQRPNKLGAREQLLNMFAYDAAEPYLDLMQEFADLRTLSQRMDRNSIACEYYSKEHGWSRIRFIAMDRKEGEPLKKVLFTIRNIQDEKLASEKDEERISQMGTERRAKILFFDILSDRVKDSLSAISEATDRIRSTKEEDDILANADEIDREGRQLLTLTSRLTDASEIYSGTIKIKEEEYSLKEMLVDVVRDSREAMEERGLKFTCDISPDIPDRLYGDDIRIRQLIQLLLTNSIRHTDRGKVGLSVYGSRSGEKEHLLITISDTGRGIHDKDLKRLTSQWAERNQYWNFTREEPGLGLTLIHELLVLMGSGLQINSEYGMGSEFYFEIEQTVIDTAPIGNLDLAELLNK